MKLSIESVDGELKDSVGSAIRAIIAAAVADGGDREQVREDIAKAVGATKVSKLTSKKSRWRFVREAVQESNDIYGEVMVKCMEEITELLVETSNKTSLKRYI